MGLIEFSSLREVEPWEIISICVQTFWPKHAFSIKMGLIELCLFRVVELWEIKLPMFKYECGYRSIIFFTHNWSNLWFTWANSNFLALAALGPKSLNFPS